MSTSTKIADQLWAMANKLRGTMDASEYKTYILSFLCYRYLSEHQDDYLKQNALEDFYSLSDNDLDDKEDYCQEIAKGIGYVIEPPYTWHRLIEKIRQHQIKASDFQEMFDAFALHAKRNEQAQFETVFSDVNLGDTRLGASTNERAKALYDIVLMINDFRFKDDSGRDVLGAVYENLIGQFAANAGKKGGEFYTPHEVSQVLARLVTLHTPPAAKQFRVYDPTMGSGSLLLTVQKELTDSKTAKGRVDFYGQELNTTTYNLARMNLMMHGVDYLNMHLNRGDTLGRDWPFAEQNGIPLPLKFDAVVANPPYSQHWDTKSENREKDVRFQGFGIAPASKADYAFVLHGLYHLEATGTMAIVLPHGVLFRGGSEGKIRQNIIDNNLLDCVIGLPPNLFYGTSIPTCVLVFKGREARGSRKDILFIDASRDFKKDKNQNKLEPDHINNIISAYSERKDVDKYAHVASLDEIKQNDYNLNIPRYVDTFEEQPVVPLSQLAEDLTQVSDEIDSTTQSLLTLLRDLHGTTPDAQKELEQFIQLFGK